MQPTGIPVLNLNAAMDFFALRITGFCPEISFNYLGQFGQEAGNNDSGGIGISLLGAGDMLSPETGQRYVIDINGMLLDNELQLIFSYNKYQLRKDSIEQLVEGFRSNLENILEHCVKKEEEELTPSDLDYSDLSIEKLEELENKVGEIDFD